MELIGRGGDEVGAVTPCLVYYISDPYKVYLQPNASRDMALCIRYGSFIGRATEVKISM
jgi:hypothetical protein